MDYVVVVLNKVTNKIVVVDGVFHKCEDAVDHMEILMKRMNIDKYSITTEVITQPR